MENENDRIYESLKNEVTLLHAKWTIYKSLFETNEHRQDLLKDVAPILSTFFQKILLDDISITICRILDLKQTSGHDNNTLYQLVDKDEPCFEDLQNLSECIEPIREKRSKFLAHRDLEMTLELFTANTKNGSTSLELNFPLSIQEVDDIFFKIQTILNYAGKTNMQYRHINTPLGPDLGVKKLIDTIKAGDFFNKLQTDNRVNFVDFIMEWENYEHKDA